MQYYATVTTEDYDRYEVGIADYNHGGYIKEVCGDENIVKVYEIEASSYQELVKKIAAIGGGYLGFLIEPMLDAGRFSEAGIRRLYEDVNARPAIEERLSQEIEAKYSVWLVTQAMLEEYEAHGILTMLKGKRK